MITVRPSEERGHANHGWLDTKHTFSFADYHDPNHMGFRSLRVINEDFVEAGKGFPPHPHRDMEIVTYVLEGAIQHRDSMGNSSIIRPGEVQRMTAGTGVTHSEFNALPDSILHLLQIWILPDQRALAPSYEQKSFSADEKRGQLRLVASRDGRDGSVTIHQDCSLSVGMFARGEKGEYRLPKDRHAWVHVARGSLVVNGTSLKPGDGAAVSSEQLLLLEGIDASEVLLFDLA